MKNQMPLTPPSNLTIYSRYALAVVSWLFAAGVVVQVFLAGLSIFDNPAHWADHRDNGDMVGLLTYPLVLLALAGRVGWRLIALAVAVLVLFHLQYPFANADTGWVAALHAVNALVMGALAPQLGRAAFGLARLRGSAPAAASEP